jgi:hypothetical protein
MSKHIVQTVGATSYMLGREYLFGHRPTVVTDCNRVSELIHDKKVESLAELPDTACDLEFEKFLKDHDGDVASAVENYTISVTPVEVEMTAKEVKVAKAAEVKAAKVAETAEAKNPPATK